MKTLDFTHDVIVAPKPMPQMLDRLCERADAVVKSAITSSCFLTGGQIVGLAFHSGAAGYCCSHDLIRKGLCRWLHSVVETGEPREVHQVRRRRLRGGSHQPHPGISIP